MADVLDTSKTVETIKTNGGKATGLKVDVTSDTDLSKMVELAEKIWVDWINQLTMPQSLHHSTQTLSSNR